MRTQQQCIGRRAKQPDSKSARADSAFSQLCRLNAAVATDHQHTHLPAQAQRMAVTLDSALVFRATACAKSLDTVTSSPRMQQRLLFVCA